MGERGPVAGAAGRSGEGLHATTDEVLYAYAAVRAGAPLPAVEGLEGASLPFAVAHGALALVASRVPAAFFAAGTGRAANPEWVARQTARHHEVCRALAFRALPLAFGAVFSGEGALRQWLGARCHALEGALLRAEGCAEWTVLLREDAPRLDAYLHRADSGLAALHAAAAQAGPAMRALLEARMASAREAARARLRERAEAALRLELASPARAVMAARAGDGASGLTALLPEAAVAALRRRLAERAHELAERGLELALTGPWPPYGFAREALGEPARDEGAPIHTPGR